MGNYGQLWLWAVLMLAPASAWAGGEKVAAALALGGLLRWDDEISAEVRRFRSQSGAEAVSRLEGAGHPLVLLAGSAWAASAAKEPRRRGRWTRATEAVLTSLVLTGALKAVTGRPRPRERLAGAGTFGAAMGDLDSSFPSAHTSAAFALATVWSQEDPKRKDWYWAGAAVIGLARLYQDEHFASDVFAGALLGIATGKYVGRHGRGLIEIKF